MYSLETVEKLLESYEQTGSYRQTAREMGVAYNTVRKYVLRAQAVRDGAIEEIVPRDRKIHRPARVVTPEIRGLIHRILEANRRKPKKQRCNAREIWQHLVASGYSLSHSTVKREVARWHAEQG
jgi:molybdenum-dependent DNA-binding transcriptional regulator ModE